jgi:dihydroorotate dehydrogenase
LTLKTCQREIVPEEKDRIRFRTSPDLPRFGRSFYCDGAKQDELLTYDVAASLLDHAKKTLTGTHVGISAVASPNEDYETLAAKTKAAAFVELNLKYSFRIKADENEFLQLAPTRLKEILDQVERCAQAFKDTPVFVKLPRELDWLPGTGELAHLLKILKKHGKSGIIVANSLKMDIPEFMMAGQERSLLGGVMCGEHLFDQTISLIQALRRSCDNAGVPIIATGGMLDPEHVLMALRSGAAAVQLCTAFIYYQIEYYETLKWNLQNRVETQGSSADTQNRQLVDISKPTIN